ncbi:GNAT family N-acetyltransferase [Vibrio sp. 10N.261.55.F6]|uniref:GNAT family N-acetyltransferase n=1 Tax=Vibrio sp. 10N.261.55.F6 TaxID=3229693 RepID=UPI00354CF894
MIFKSIDKSTIDDVVVVHKMAYLNGHFTSDFDDSLLRAYYEALIVPSSVDYSFIAYVNNNPIGLVLCGTDLNEQVKKFVEHNKFRLSGLILKNPKYILPKIKAIFSRFSKKQGKWESSAKFRLLSIAVSSEYQGKGYGKNLLMELEKRIINKNQNIYGLSVKNENKKAITFYQSLGFRLEKKESKTSYYIKDV